MSETLGRIPQDLGERNLYYREVIPYGHTNIGRLTPIIAADDTWLVAELILWIVLYDNSVNHAITNENTVSERDAMDLLIEARLNKVLDLLTPFSGLTETDRNTYGLHLRVTSNAHHTVVSRAPSGSVINQQHLAATGRAIDPLNPNATKLPDGVFLILWLGYLVVDPVAVAPAKVFLGWSVSIDCDLEFPAAWAKKDCMVEAHYEDKHHGKSLISPAIPVTVI